MPASPDKDPQVTPTPSPAPAARQARAGRAQRRRPGQGRRRVRQQAGAGRRDRFRPDPTPCSDDMHRLVEGIPQHPLREVLPAALPARTRLSGRLRAVRGTHPRQHERGGRRCSQSGAAPPAGGGAGRAVTHVGPDRHRQPVRHGRHRPRRVQRGRTRGTAARQARHPRVTHRSRAGRARGTDACVASRLRGLVVRARGRGPAVRHSRRRRERRPVVRRTRRRRVPAGVDRAPHACRPMRAIATDARRQDTASRSTTSPRVRVCSRLYRHAVTGLDGDGTSAADARLPLATHTQRCHTRIAIAPCATPVPLDGLLATVDRVVGRCQNTLPRDLELLAVHRAHREPQFLEDVLRDLLAAVHGLVRDEHPNATIRIRATSFESIHDFDLDGEVVASVRELDRAGR